MTDPRPPHDLTGRVACVTGASSGLGRRAALALAGAGARVVGLARRGEALAGPEREAEGGDAFRALRQAAMAAPKVMLAP